jgi:hypothetical protein
MREVSQAETRRRTLARIGTGPAAFQRCGHPSSFELGVDFLHVLAVDESLELAEGRHEGNGAYWSVDIGPVRDYI